jgi:hypothetical protein
MLIADMHDKVNTMGYLPYRKHSTHEIHVGIVELPDYAEHKH